MFTKRGIEMNRALHTFDLRGEDLRGASVLSVRIFLQDLGLDIPTGNIEDITSDYEKYYRTFSEKARARVKADYVEKVLCIYLMPPDILKDVTFISSDGKEMIPNEQDDLHVIFFVDGTREWKLVRSIQVLCYDIFTLQTAAA